MPEILSHMIYYEVLSLLSKPNVGLITNNLVLDFLDMVFAGLVVVDEIISNPSVIFYLNLAKSGNTSGPIPRYVDGIWFGWGCLVAVDDILVASDNEIGLYNFRLFDIIIFANKL